MRFLVSRGWDDWAKPCDDAVKGTFLRRDVRTVDCPTKIPCFAGRPGDATASWYGIGANHRVEGGRIVRDVPDEGWFVEVESLEALVALCVKYGDAGIVRTDLTDGTPKLVLDTNVGD